MDGSPLFKQVYGRWDHYGMATTEEVVIPVGTVMHKGHFLDLKAGDESKFVLASGNCVGYTTQEMDAIGHTDFATTLVNDYFQVTDRAIKVGQAITVRQLHVDGKFESEGLGGAGPGNHVVTSGTGALAAGTAKDTELSLHMGSIRIAQSGDFVHFHLVQSNLTPNVAGNLRILCKKVSPYPMP